MDFAVQGNGRCLGAVPRQRLETRAGEVSKGVTVRIPEVEQITQELAARLPGMYGVGNVQLFFDANSRSTKVIEINPRFGGGYPLSHAAGADFITGMLEPRRDVDLPPLTWEAGVTMLRYDAEVFVRDKSNGSL